MQDEFRSKRVNLTISMALLKRVDMLASRDYASRSDIIRLALLEYIRRPENELPQAGDPDLKRVQAAHPEIPPDDIALLKLLQDTN
jgi:hypothetical protein